MALNVGELYVQINARTGGLVRGGKDVNRFVNRSSAGFKRVASAAKSMGVALGLAVGVDSIRRAVLLADEFKVLENRVRTATKSTGDFNKVNKELFDISQRTGTALRGNVSLFQSLARSASEIGVTNDEVLSITETLGQLGTIGGSTTEEMNNGFRQFSQAIAGGTLRAEEFNSIFENIPEVGNALARQLGVGVGELRRMSAEGELTSKVLTDAFLAIGPEVQKAFEDLPPTLGQAIQRLTNSWGKFVLQIDKTLGISQGIAKILTRIGEFISGDFSPQMQIVKEIFMGVWDVAKALFDVLVQVGKILLIPVRTMFKLQGGTDTWRDTFQVIVGIIKIVAQVLTAVLGVLFKVGTAIAEVVLRPFAMLGNLVREVFLTVGEFILNFYLNLYEKIAGILQNIPGLKGVGEGLQGSIDNIRAEIAAIQERRAAITEDSDAADQQTEKDIERNTLKTEAEATNLIAQLANTQGFLAKSAVLKKKFADKEFSDQANAFGKQLSQAAQHNKAAFQLNKAANLSNAIIDGYSSIVSSFKFGSEIGGPIVGGIFAAIAAVATAAQISAIRGESYSGGRASGGSVSGGRMYRVNENGPELLSTGGKDYLMMGSQGGQVTSNRNLRGGGVDKRPINVIVNNTGPPITAVASQSETAEQTLINLAIEGAERRVATGIRSGNSPVAVALQGTYGVNRAAGAR